MIPTIDLGSIAVLGTLIGIVKAIWGAIVASSVWLKNTFVVFISSSKIWATAIFLSIVLFIAGLVAQIMSRVVGEMANAVFQRLVYDDAFSFEFGVVNQIWDWSTFVSLAVFIVTYTTTITLLHSSIRFIRGLVGKFTTLVAAWKT